MSAQSDHSHCRVQDDGVPVLHVEPICIRLRQLRVVVQELEQDSNEVVAPRPPSMSTRAKQKRKFGQKGRLKVRSTTQKNEICNSKNIQRENLSPLRLKLIQKNLNRIKLQYYRFILIQKNLHHAFVQLFPPRWYKPRVHWNHDLWEKLWTLCHYLKALGARLLARHSVLPRVLIMSSQGTKQIDVRKGLFWAGGDAMRGCFPNKGKTCNSFSTTTLVAEACVATRGPRLVGPRVPSSRASTVALVPFLVGARSWCRRVRGVAHPLHNAQCGQRGQRCCLRTPPAVMRSECWPLSHSTAQPRKSLGPERRQPA